jgi:hypothetical protein
MDLDSKAARNKKNKLNKKRKKQAAKLMAIQKYHLNQSNPSDMELLMVLAEEEYLQPQTDTQSVMKVKTTKIDYMRTDKASKTNRFAPEVLLSVKNEETKEQAGRAVTCFECSLGQPVRTVEKPDKSEGKEKHVFTKHQLSVCKELIERGVFAVATHFCKTCISTDPDQFKMCLICAIDHKKCHMSH